MTRICWFNWCSRSNREHLFVAFRFLNKALLVISSPVYGLSAFTDHFGRACRGIFLSISATTQPGAPPQSAQQVFDAIPVCIRVNVHVHPRALFHRRPVMLTSMASKGICWEQRPSNVLQARKLGRAKPHLLNFDCFPSGTPPGPRS